jgi:type IV secretory pathway component VirB8
VALRKPMTLEEFLDWEERRNSRAAFVNQVLDFQAARSIAPTRRQDACHRACCFVVVTAVVAQMSVADRFLPMKACGKYSSSISPDQDL